MDNTNIDFKESFKQIQKEIPLEYTLQDVYLDSEAINTTFNTIESSLNKLYENTRYLEDMISYCNAFLNLKIKEYSEDIQETLKGIEDIRDINKNSAYIEYLCKFKDDLSIKKDRDGTIIPNMLFKENSLMLGIKKEEIISYSHLSKQSSYVPYSNNINEVKTEPYRTFYIEEKIANKGVSETITITLDKPTELNYINIQPVNAEIQNLRLIYVNGIEEYIEYTNGIIPTAIIAQIKFDLVNKQYTTSKYYMNKSKLTDDVWNKIKEYEYKYALDVSSKLEMDEVIARVYKDKTEIFQTNISNKENIVEKQMHTYIFGIDTIQLKHIEQETDSCFISESIVLGELKETEFIQLHIEEVVDENAVIEYSILDGDTEVNILPYGNTIIKNERLFATPPLRFSQSESLAHTIKKDGMTVDISLDDAKLQLLNRFSIDYFPENKYNYTPINSNIKIKAVIRSYNKGINNSYLKSIRVRKYGGDAPWTNM